MAVGSSDMRSETSHMPPVFVFICYCNKILFVHLTLVRGAIGNKNINITYSRHLTTWVRGAVAIIKYCLGT